MVTEHRYLTEADAVKIYSLATKLDGIPDNTYPPSPPPVSPSPVPQIIVTPTPRRRNR